MDVSVIDGIDRQLAGYREAGDAPLPPCPLVSDAFNSNPPHRVGIAHLLLKPRFLLIDPTGTGKTPQTIVSYAYLRQVQPTMKLLVMTKLSALMQWAAAVRRFTPSLGVQVAGYDERGRDLPPEARPAQYARWFSGECPVLISTYQTIALDWTYSVLKAGETLHKKRGEDAVLRRLKFPADGLGLYATVLDEIQVVRGHRGSLYYPAMIHITRHARYAWGATATPIMSKLDDLYGIVELVRYNTLRPYSDFASRYYVRELKKIKLKQKSGPPKERRYYEILGTKDLDQLMARVAPFMLQRPMSVFGAHLPEIRITSTLIDMKPAQRKVYDRIVAQHFPKQTAPDSTGTAAKIALRQVAGNTMAKITSLLYAQLAVDAPAVLGITGAPSAKLDELLRLLDEEHATDQVLVYTRFEQVATYLATALKDRGITVGRITGTESGAKRRETQLAFQSGALRVCLLTSAGGEAIELQAANTLIFYDLPWSWGEFVQVVGRARRQGSRHASLLLRLLGVPHTIDTHTLTLLQNREQLIAATFTNTDLYLKSASYDDASVFFTAPDDALSSDTKTSASFVDDLFARVAEGAE